MSTFKPVPGQYLTKARSPRVYTAALGNVATPTIAGEAVLFIDSADNVLKIKDSAGIVTSYNTALQYKPSVKAASTANIVGVYSNNVFTVTATVALTLDSITPVLNARVLIRAQTEQLQNGIYTITTLGGSGISCVLTRATEFDSTPEMVGALVAVETGSTLANTIWLCNTDSAGVVGTAAIVFTQFVLNTLTSLAVNGPITINGNSVITATQSNVSAFPGSITLSGNNVAGSNGGSINTSGYNNGAARTGGNINTSANMGGSGGFIDTSNNGGFINTTGNGSSLRGGFIITSGNNFGFTLPSSGTGGGYIYTAGNNGGNGGNINTSGFNNGVLATAGGGINTSAGNNSRGGDINTSAGNNSRGGFINTSGNITSIPTVTGSGGGYIFTAGNNGGNGGNINTSGFNNGVTAIAGGDINTSAGNSSRGGFINTSGNITSLPAVIGNGGGYIFTAANNGGNGGNINTSGSNNGSVARAGGDINTSASVGNNGGSINTYGNGLGAGGSINTSAGGGNINTGTINGNIELGISANRTVLKASGVACSNINLPSTNNSVIMCNKDTAINLALVSSFF